MLRGQRSIEPSSPSVDDSMQESELSLPLNAKFARRETNRRNVEKRRIEQRASARGHSGSPSIRTLVLSRPFPSALEALHDIDSLTESQEWAGQMKPVCDARSPVASRLLDGFRRHLVRSVFCRTRDNRLISLGLCETRKYPWSASTVLPVVSRLSHRSRLLLHRLRRRFPLRLLLHWLFVRP